MYGNVSERDERLVYKVDEVADLLRVDKRVVYEMIRREEIFAIRIGRAIRIPKWVVEELLATPEEENPE